MHRLTGTARALVVLALLTAAGNRWASGNEPQTPPNSRLTPVLDAVRRGRLGAAQEAARQAAEADPKDAVAEQVYGILLAVQGHVREAEQAFGAALQRGPNLAPTATGLEGLAQPETAFSDALYRQKIVLSLSAGAAAARNNLGAVMVIQNHAAAGQGQLDAATSLVPDWGTPWANTAVAWMERNRPKQAMKAAQKALDLGEITAKVYTILAEAAYRQGQYDEALQYLDRGAQLEPNYAYGLYIRALIYRKQLRTRDADRALFQALALSPAVAAESRYVPLRDQIRTGLGSENEDQERYLANGQPAQIPYRAFFNRDARQVEGLSNAYQRRDFGEGILGNNLLGGSGALYAGSNTESGGRPGVSADPLNTTPSATFGMNRTNLSWLQQLGLGAATRVLLHAGYGHNGVSLQPAPGTASSRVLNDEQMALEGRLEQALFHGITLKTGLSWLNNRRAGAPAPTVAPVGGAAAEARGTGSPTIGPVEPNEQILPNGASNLYNFYAFGRKRLNNRTTLAAGPVVGSRGGSTFVLPYLDARRILTGRQTLRLSVLPRVMNAAADLYPSEALAAPPQMDQVDRREEDTHIYNREPLLAGPNGRLVSMELGWSFVGKAHQTLGVTLFHRHFNDMFIIAEDPRLSANLSLAPVDRGEASGIEVNYDQPVLLGLVLHTFTRYQQTHLTDTTCPDQTSSSQLPQFPPWQAGFRLDAPDLGGWQVGVETLYIGGRDTRINVEDQSGLIVTTRQATPCDIVLPQDAAAIVNLYITGRLGNNGSMFLNVYHLIRSGSFYPGTPLHQNVVGGLEYHF